MSEIKNNKVKKFASINLSQTFFLIFFLLKPFYLFQSGSLQIGDIFLVMSFFSHILTNGIKLENKDYYFITFLFFVFCINGMYYLRYQQLSLLIACSYYVFNFLVIICFKEYINDTRFMTKFELICKINILIQLGIYVTGLGKYWFGTYRYTGTYNDPNQLGFAIVSTFFILYLLNAKRLILYFTISAFLIFKTYSNGMLIAISILVAFYIITLFKQKKILLSQKKIIIIFCVLISILLIIFIKKDTLGINLDLDKFRFEDKLNKTESPLQSFIYDRNLTIITIHPEYFIYGFGEGYSERSYLLHGELHSTVISLCFYYGIIPFSFLVAWVVQNLKNISVRVIPVYIALFVEAISLVNHRQPSFWIIILLGSCNLSTNVKIHETCEIDSWKKNGL